LYSSFFTLISLATLVDACTPIEIHLALEFPKYLFRFFQGTTVRLGGAEARRSVKETRNYFVLMATPDREGSGDGTTTATTSGGGITRGPELAVDGIVAMRSMAEQVGVLMVLFSKALVCQKGARRGVVVCLRFYPLM
jgi:hypothetical protein